MSDPKADIEPDILAEPARSGDQTYHRMVVSSLTLDQVQKYGGGEAASATKLLQNNYPVQCSQLASSKPGNFARALGEFEAFEGTVLLNGIKSRYDQLNSQ